MLLGNAVIAEKDQTDKAIKLFHNRDEDKWWIDVHFKNGDRNERSKILSCKDKGHAFTLYECLHDADLIY